MLTFAKLSLVTVTSLSLVERTTCFSMGAPDSACAQMTPGHAHESQTGAPPANFTLSKKAVQPGQMIGIELSTTDNSQFKGFIIQARAVKQKDRQVGSFVVSGDDASYMTCGRGIHNSITHRKSNGKSSVKAKWRAPTDFEGDVVFRYTCLKEYQTFWVGLETDTVRVSRSIEEQSEVDDDSASDDNDDSSEKEENILKPSIKTEEESNNINSIEVVDKNVIDKDAAKNSEFDFAFIDSDKEKKEVDDDDDDDDIPQPAQSAVIPQPSSSTEEKIEEADNFTPIYISSTTTLKTTTTTTEEPKEPLRIINGILQHTDPEDPIFEGCNSTKACFGLPEGCVQSQKCSLIVAYKPDRLDYHFEMKGLSNGYIAMGLSRDERMGDDLTTSCLIESNGGVGIVTGFNKGYRGNKNIARGTGNKGTEEAMKDGIAERIDFSRREGWISCSWKRTRRATIEGQVWNLETDKYHVMLAQGSVRDGVLNKHRVKSISGHPAGLGEVGPVKAKSRLFIILHGSFMIGAWVCAASLGIMIARYYKQTWTASRCCNLDQWFIWHRLLMMLTWGLTIAGFVLILLELDGLSKTFDTNPHALLGFITVGLCFLQPFLALIRCSPNHRHRGWFNWTHWFIGNSAQILGIVCIFYAVDLSKAELPRPETDWLLVGFVGFHFITHLLMSCVTCVSESQNNKSGYPLAMRPMTRNGHAYPDYEELKRDAPGSSVRIFVLIVYMLVNVIVTAALVLLVVMAPTRSTLEEFGILPSVQA